LTSWRRCARLELPQHNQFKQAAKGAPVTRKTASTGEVYAKPGSENYGLHAGVLGPLETLAQSVSAMAPSTSPSLTIPLVFALAGNATWFVYLLATGATLLVGFCVSRFARLSASPGSLYSYASDTLPPAFGVVAVMIFHFGFQIDMDQFRLKGASVSSLGPALVLAMFTFVGFESATTLGNEAREPLKTIPRAVMQAVILGGIFFMLCSYSEVLGFRGASSMLSDTVSPLHQLAIKVGVSPLGVGIDIGAAVAMFACVLACTTAAARVLLRMAHGKMLLAALERTNKRHGTPGTAIALSSGLMFAATAAMALRGVTGADMYDLLGSLSVFGFLTAYALVAVALPFARRALGQHSHWVAGISVLTVLVMILIVVFDLRSATDVNHARITWIYLSYISLGVAWYFMRRTKANPLVP
jgi:amino acid transporter